VDDFGTGWSSLAQLKRLPVDVLKVDRAFVDGLGTDPEDTAIVASILSLAHAMGLHVIAEGVETPLQASALAELGCPVAQGFLFAPAVAASGLPGLIGRGGRVRVDRSWGMARRERAAQGLLDSLLAAFVPGSSS
jgi:EAL domain-containing protein (putative c-di-GMP-specific phosphodiesterase class I)